MKLVGLTSQIHTKSQLEQTSKAISRALKRLGSGNRVATFSDDPASASLNIMLQAQVRGLRAGIQNINSAKGKVATAEAALSSQLDLVEQMRLLALQASNESLSSSERESLNKEVKQVLSEFKRLTSDSSLNDIQINLGMNSTNSIGFDLDSSDSSEIFQKQVGTGQFSTAQTYMIEGAVNATQAVDLNNDGYVDVLYIDQTTGVLGVMLGNGDGTFKQRMTFREDSSTTVGNLAIGDTDNDGDIDAITRGGAYLNQGDGTFPLAGTNILKAFSTGAAALVDIVYTKATSSEVSIFMNQGNGSFSENLLSGWLVNILSQANLQMQIVVALLRD